MRHEKIYAARQEQIIKQRELIAQLEVQQTAGQVQLSVIERKLLVENAKLRELENSTTFITGMISALNESFDAEVEKKTQAGFELGYSTRKKVEKNPKKPLAGEAGGRMVKMDKK